MDYRSYCGLPQLNKNHWIFKKIHWISVLDFEPVMIVLCQGHGPGSLFGGPFVLCNIYHRSGHQFDTMLWCCVYTPKTTHTATSTK
jgi:hypothetical protein